MPFPSGFKTKEEYNTYMRDYRKRKKEEGLTLRSGVKEYKELLIEFLGGKCKNCGSTEHLEISHKIPIKKGGLNKVENIELLCHKCHRYSIFGKPGTKEHHNNYMRHYWRQNPKKYEAHKKHCYENEKRKKKSLNKPDGRALWMHKDSEKPVTKNSQ